MANAYCHSWEQSLPTSSQIASVLRHRTMSFQTSNRASNPLSLSLSLTTPRERYTDYTVIIQYYTVAETCFCFYLAQHIVTKFHRISTHSCSLPLLLVFHPLSDMTYTQQRIREKKNTAIKHVRNCLKMSTNNILIFHWNFYDITSVAVFCFSFPHNS